MKHWLDPVRAALDLRGKTATFFFRDDDAGWEDDRLFHLLDLFAGFELPVDLAVIPQALTSELSCKLGETLAQDPERIGIHQHGFAHINHEPQGRKCEFGPGRTSARQEQDIALGKQVLFEAFGSFVQPIFTPPWNRCTPVTAASLVRLGFQTLSRDATAPAFNISELVELPVRVDWFAKRKGERLSLSEVGQLIARAVEGDDRVGDHAISDHAISDHAIGIMFHHAVMDSEERRAAGELLGLLSAHPRAQGRFMQFLTAAYRPA